MLTAEKRQVILIYLAIILAAFIALGQIRQNDFLDYDDPGHITENPHVRHGLTQKGFSWAFTTTFTSSAIPLTWLSHMLDCELFGLNPAGHHLTSLLFHTASALLLFWVLKKTTSALWPSAFVAAVFAIHPLNVEPVAWAAARNHVLGVFFWMLTVASYVRYVEKPTSKKYLLVLLFFELGIMAKPMVVTLPFVLLLLDYWPLGRFSQSIMLWRLFREKIPLFALSLISSSTTFFLQKSGGVMAPLKLFSLSARLSNALVSYLTYLGKIIYPSRLAVLYPHPGKTLPLWQPLVCFVVLVCITGLVIYAAKRRPYLLAGWLWFLGILFPVIGLVQAGFKAMADRYAYLPIVGIAIMIAWSADELIAARRLWKIFFRISAGAVLVVLLLVARLQVGHWKNSFTLYEHTLAVTENNYIILNSYGRVLTDARRYDEAIRHLNEALRINPKFSLSYYNLGKVFLIQEKFDQAVACFNEVLRLEPGDPYAHYKLGLAMTALGRYDDAIEHFYAAMSKKPNTPEVYYNLARVFYLQGKPELTVKYCAHALKLKPNYLMARLVLAHTSAEMGEFRNAVEHYYKALQFEPNRIYTLRNLAWILAAADDTALRDPAAAVKFAQKACEFTDYKQAKVLDTLAVAYAAAGNFDQAVKTADKAIEVALSCGEKELADEIDRQRQLYKTHQPYRLPPPMQNLNKNLTADDIIKTE